MRKPLIAVSLGVLSSVLAGCISEPKFEFRRVGQVQWGAPSDGLQAGLVAETWRQVGDPEFVSPPPGFVLLLRNVGDRPMRFVELNQWCQGGTDDRSLGELRLTLPDSSQRTIEGVFRQPASQHLVSVLEPGEEFATSFNGAFLEDVLYPAALLEVSVVLTYHNDQSTVAITDFEPTFSESMIENVWTGKVETGPLKMAFER